MNGIGNRYFGGALRCQNNYVHNWYINLFSMFQEKLRSYILACQDEETGGFADRPGDMVRLNNRQVVIRPGIRAITFFFFQYKEDGFMEF